MTRQHQHQKGFGLVIALLLVGVVTAVLTGFYQSRNGQVLKKEAEIAGWEGAKLARAARIYSRNQIQARPNLVTELSIAGTGPENVPIATLIAAGLLPNDFLRLDGTTYVNALNQPVRIYLANYPVDGNPADATTVPTAYVFFENTDTTQPHLQKMSSLMQDVVRSIRTRNVSVSAPLYNDTTNLTGACNGGEATVALWDSGCLSENDYDLLVDGGLDDDDVFPIGSFIIPAWRSVSFDTRAMMRFPQPEQPGLQTMLADLEMANMMDCDANNDGIPDQNFVTVPTDSGQVNTEFCRSLSDDNTAGSEVDNRRSINNVANINNSLGLIVDPQATGDVSISAVDGSISTSGDEPNALDITGTFQGTGDAFVLGDSLSVVGAMHVDKNIRVISDDPAPLVPASADIESLRANNSVSESIQIRNRPSLDSTVAVSGTTEDINRLISNNDTVTQILKIAENTTGNKTIRVNNTAVVNGNLNPTSAVISGTGNASPLFSYVTGSLESRRINIAGTIYAGKSVNIQGTTRAANMFSVTTNAGLPKTAECFGDCPKRERAAECTNLQSSGFFPVLGYSNFQECLNDS